MRQLILMVDFQAFFRRQRWLGIQRRNEFFNKQEILELLKGFTIEYFEEKEFDGKTTQGNIKHWYAFNVIAKKNEEGEQNGTRI